ncbi:transcriptional repressor NrdR [Formicincola oecophyllae]|uniref:Transcriptional repressor NrdR n=1 Tax=Formicincola oecophyllae TaxID=2558361 RepID=A0A4Y6UCW1_9PROT|nr:transcriptional regulator NrdR [Formicincola oecophyllae]QDH14221.1 transcriptional repressor NrdR [Formicincola oecophyllae]
MHCPYCEHSDTQVKDSRPFEEGTVIRRRRVCTGCGERFTTVERVQLRELTVVKSNGRRAPFNREKLMDSIRLALRKRPVDEAAQERMVSNIVHTLEAMGEAEVPTRHIGALAMDALRRTDDVAYVRFASVYRNFREASAFTEILSDLDGDEGTPPGCANSPPPGPGRVRGPG